MARRSSLLKSLVMIHFPADSAGDFAMRGRFFDQGGMFSQIQPERVFPRAIPCEVRELVREVLKEQSHTFGKLYSHGGRPTMTECIFGWANNMARCARPSIEVSQPSLQTSYSISSPTIVRIPKLIAA
jgi:hypothetical protein